MNAKIFFRQKCEFVPASASPYSSARNLSDSTAKPFEHHKGGVRKLKRTETDYFISEVIKCCLPALCIRWLLRDRAHTRPRPASDGHTAFVRLFTCEVSQGHVYGSVVDETDAELRESVHCTVDHLASQQVAHVTILGVRSHASYHVTGINVCNFAALACSFELSRQHFFEHGAVVREDDVAACISSCMRRAADRLRRLISVQHLHSARMGARVTA
jgi:hypothetical protein